jgi:DNA-binding NarL/FixJ family response regulator
VRVVIAEDHVLLADGIARLIAAHGDEVVATVGEAPALAPAVGELRPDVAVVDVRLPPGFRDDGIRAALEVRRQWPGVGILVLSQYVETVYARELLTAGGGGIGYLLKDRITRPAEFVEALRRVAAGGAAFDPEVVGQLLTRHDAMTGVEALTEREREVLGLMAEGRSNTAIAAGLFIAEATVAKHIGAIFGKLRLEQSDDDHRRVLAVLAFLGR